MERLFLVLFLLGCGHIPKADPNGVPAPWPAAPTPIAKPGAAAPKEKPDEKGDEKKPIAPPLKRDLLPAPEPQT